MVVERCPRYLKKGNLDKIEKGEEIRVSVKLRCGNLENVNKYWLEDDCCNEYYGGPAAIPRRARTCTNMCQIRLSDTNNAHRTRYFDWLSRDSVIGRHKNHEAL